MIDRRLSQLPRVYVGTFTRLAPHPRGRGEGIYVYALDPGAGTMTSLSLAPDVPNPSFLAVAPNRRFLYAVNADPEIDGHPGGAVSAFAIEPSTGALTFLNRQPSHGAGPCHVSVDRAGRWVLVANYGGGSVAVLPIQADGRLGPATDVVQHRGSSAHPTRQSAPHAHSLNLDPANRFALVCDLGLDRVMIYRFDADAGRLLPNEAQPWAALHPGAGPRHLAFHPSQPVVYVINELDSTLTVFGYDAAAGRLEARQTLSTLPDGYSGTSSCADVHVHPSGSYVYGSNRGHDSLAIFAVDPTTGLLTGAGHEPTHGRTPRNFTFAAAGRLLLVANEDSDNIVAFRVDDEGGRRTLIGEIARIPSAVCLRVVEPGGAGIRLAIDHPIR